MRKALLLIATTALAGCSLQPKYVRGELPVPPSWPVAIPTCGKARRRCPP